MPQMVSAAPLPRTNSHFAQKSFEKLFLKFFKVGICSEMSLQKPTMQERVEIPSRADRCGRDQPAPYHHASNYRPAKENVELNFANI